MIDRIFKNLKTSLTGIFILIICFTLVYFGKATLTEVSAFLGMAFTLLFVKDPKPKL